LTGLPRWAIVEFAAVDHDATPPDPSTAMTQAELDNFRQQLLELRRRLRGDVSHLTSEALRKTGGEASGSLSNTPIHMADLGTDNFEQEFTLGLIQNEEQALDEITAALDRLQQGTFGRCEECHKDIPRARLQALPYARYCVECARKLEQST
jgi:RNA polymerase-binding transcription factor DksA